MMLPLDGAERITEALWQASRSLSELGIGDVAWPAPEAIEVLRCLDGTRAVVLGGDVYDEDERGLTSSYDNWACEPEAGESIEEYARRSREVARDRILLYSRIASRPRYFSLMLAPRDGMWGTSSLANRPG